MALAEQLPAAPPSTPNRSPDRHWLARATGANIRAYRKLRGLTLDQVASKCGTTPQTIQRLETAKMTMSLEWLQQLAEVLGVAPHQFIGGPGSLAEANRATIKARTELAALRAAILELTKMAMDIVPEQPHEENRDAPVR
jgi:transcriptional regulator with XRE-family HTH domain